MISIIISTIPGREEAYKKLCDSIEKYTKDFEIVTYKDNPEKSIPVAEAWNDGASRAKGDFLVFLNDDMLVTEGWVDEQFKMWNKLPLAGSLAFKVYDDLGNVQSRGHSFSDLQPYLPPEEASEVDYSDHPFTTKRNWEKVGGFTAHGHLYYEDADFGLKLQRIGLKNYYNSKAVLHHKTIGLRVGTEGDKKRRKYNETVIQQKAKESFYKSWEYYLIHKNTIPEVI